MGDKDIIIGRVINVTGMIGVSAGIVLLAFGMVLLLFKHRLPAVYTVRYWAKSGGLASYGADVLDQWRGAASYVDRIFKGEKPAQLPVVQPTKFELVINLKTAKALALTIPPGVLALADEVIE